MFDFFKKKEEKNLHQLLRLRLRPRRHNLGGFSSTRN